MRSQAGRPFACLKPIAPTAATSPRSRCALFRSLSTTNNNNLHTNGPPALDRRATHLADLTITCRRNHHKRSGRPNRANGRCGVDCRSFSSPRRGTILAHKIERSPRDRLGKRLIKSQSIASGLRPSSGLGVKPNFRPRVWVGGV